ncbi:hypothetical protein G7Y89_g10125 [Cudoniella acicularis]|uniref:Uncharacterized protein n=1 Tax=Cudoniella acicularis TaxID=354080 RepID=A0A8H4RG35_9HELO|nr:hypothetical protein G7Y89_g10125 [Cudoniella acicularis]
MVSISISLSISRQSSRRSSVNSHVVNEREWNKDSKHQQQQPPPYTNTNTQTSHTRAASVSTNSNSLSYTSTPLLRSINNSLEQLLAPAAPPGKKQPDSKVGGFGGRYTSSNKRVRVMAPKEHVVNKGPAGPVDIHGGAERERKISFGIGGAGNIRRPSEVIYPPRVNADGTRRRSSVWSSISSVSPGSSPDGKRASLMNFFGRKNSVQNDNEGLGETPSEQGVHFKDVDLGGKKKVEVE